MQQIELYSGFIEALRVGVSCSSCGKQLSIEDAALYDDTWYCAEHELALFPPTAVTLP
jgi:hypothetical protein